MIHTADIWKKSLRQGVTFYNRKKYSSVAISVGMCLDGNNRYPEDNEHIDSSSPRSILTDIDITCIEMTTFEA